MRHYHSRAAGVTIGGIVVTRTEIVALPLDTPPADLLERVLAEHYTRVPIYSGSIDDVLGVVHLKDLTQHVRQGGRELAEILKPVMRIPERKPILPLLADMQRAFVRRAIVKDEFGVTLRLVTQEDILEEIVGTSARNCLSPSDSGPCRRERRALDRRAS